MCRLSMVRLVVLIDIAYERNVRLVLFCRAKVDDLFSVADVMVRQQPWVLLALSRLQ